ncbi:unnamed protein product [Kluyveromyces dobzhanskii CBS 2104]|uniref:WGS project CCBQ000000000 data, contig 00272 n=1 Tax=Kluyveromyces dobzhanskii CBS 2104 TaxID=1427455 RepID=A0A0A8LB37_9SACH|nr:unnamed protein product [Kluyveromyces dobzhanskii CBS 2104]
MVDFEKEIRHHQHNHHVPHHEIEAKDNGEIPSVPPVKRLACANCRRRRKKCDLEYPCGRCAELGLECNINKVDLRKKRYNMTYVKNLEDHVAQMELRLREYAKLAEEILPEAASDAKKLLVDDVLNGLSPMPSNDPSSATEKLTKPITSKAAYSMEKSSGDTRNVEGTEENSTKMNEPAVSSSSTHHDVLRNKKFVKGSIYPEGPTSYKKRKRDTPSIFTQPSQRIDDLKSTVIIRKKFDANDGRLNSDPAIIQSLSYFYKWLYPGNFIFVHRESFLYGFFNHADETYDNSQYCSEELVYAVAAIGSRVSTEYRHLSEKYYQLAKTSLLKIVFEEQSIAKITTVQALLCLAFYELGNGENQLAWYFSGLAIRVGYDMGFQLDPKVWITDESINENQNLSDSELEIRSRIYWGCYIADHFICLILGRAPSLTVSNSTVPESDELPEIEGTQDFRYESNTVLQVSLPLKNLMILSRIIQIFTSKIFIEPNTTSQRIEYLQKFNLKVSNWRQSLPEFLKWSKPLVQSIEISTDPTISYFWYHYYIVLITFNKPFMEDCEEAKAVVIDLLGDLKTLLSNLKLKFGNSFQQGTLYHLYTCLLSISCFQKLKSMGPDPLIQSTFPNLSLELNWFKSVFHELSNVYDLPNKIEEEDLELEQQHENPAHLNYLNLHQGYQGYQGFQGFQGFHQMNNIHDFSLSDEIDDLIKQVFGFDTWNMNPTYHQV